MAFLTPGDLSPFTSATPEQLAVMIVDVEASAVDVAPCLMDPDGLSDAALAVVVATLRGAVLRWADYATRDDRQMVAGPFSIGQAGRPQERRSLLWPTEIVTLQALCAALSGRVPSSIGQIRLATPAWWVR